MIDKKEPVQPCNLEASPVLEDRTGPDNALKCPPEQDSDAHDDAGLHDKLQSPMKQDSDAQVHDKLQSPMEQDSDAQVHDKLQSPLEQDLDARDDVGLHDELQSPAEQEPKWMEGLTTEVRRRVQRLQKFQSQHDEVEKKLYKEIQELEEKYEDSIKLLYNERSEIVNGEGDVESNTNETAEEATSDKKATKVEGIPYFWLTAMKNNKFLALMITRSDEEALKYLKDIKCCTIGDPLELKLDFFFDTNPFFTNSILTRTYTEIDKHEEITNAPSTGTKINWFPEKSQTGEIRPKRKTRLPEKSLTRVILPKRYFLTREIRRKRKTRLPKKSLTREIRPKRKTRTEKSVSFFNFFGDGDCEDGIGHILQNKIIPNAVSWYTRESLQKKIIPNAVSWYKRESLQKKNIWYTRESLQEDSDESESSKQEDESDELKDLFGDEYVDKNGWSWLPFRESLPEDSDETSQEDSDEIYQEDSDETESSKQEDEEDEFDEYEDENGEDEFDEYEDENEDENGEDENGEDEFDEYEDENGEDENGEDEFDEYEDENEGDGEASKKLRKSRRLQDLAARKSRRIR